MHAFQSEINLSDSPELNLTGSCGYQIRDNQIVLNIGAIASHRSAGDISGTLALELWALDRPYAGGHFSGSALCATEIGQVHGQHFLADCTHLLDFQEPAEGTWYLALMLREWTGTGYTTRDYVNFAVPYVVKARPVVARGVVGNVISVDFDSGQRAPLTDRDSSSNPQSEKADVAKADTSDQRDTDEETISLNSASLGEIAGVKGISKKVAENIVASRPYNSVDEVLQVKGVGAKLLDRIRQFIKL